MICLAVTMCLAFGVFAACGKKVTPPAPIIPQYTVTFDTVGGNEIAPKTVVENDRISYHVATKAGYEFLGWYTEPEYLIQYDFDTKITKNFTLYAKWEIAPLMWSPNANLASAQWNTLYGANIGGASAGGGTITYALRSGYFLPAGLALANGYINGTVTTTDFGDYTFKIIATVAQTGVTAEREFTISVGHKRVTVIEPVYTGGTLYYGDTLPIDEISTPTEGGTVAFVGGQVLVTGTSSYNWEFTIDPEIAPYCMFENLTGKISITVDRAYPQITVNGDYFLGQNSLTYGDPLPDLALAMSFPVNKTVEGSIRFMYAGYTQMPHPETGQNISVPVLATLLAGKRMYYWVFEPTDTVNYQTVQDQVELTVNKATYPDTVTALYDGGTLYVGDELPEITTVDPEHVGTITLNFGQTIQLGTHDYNWTFISANENYEIVTGVISLTAEERNETDTLTTAIFGATVSCTDCFDWTPLNEFDPSLIDPSDTENEAIYASVLSGEYAYQDYLDWFIANPLYILRFNHDLASVAQQIVESGEFNATLRAQYFGFVTGVDDTQPRIFVETLNCHYAISFNRDDWRVLSIRQWFEIDANTQQDFYFRPTGGDTVDYYLYCSLLLIDEVTVGEETKSVLIQSWYYKETQTIDFPFYGEMNYKSRVVIGFSSSNAEFNEIYLLTDAEGEWNLEYIWETYAEWLTETPWDTERNGRRVIVFTE